MEVGKLSDIRMREPENDEYAIVMDIWELEDLEEVLSQIIRYSQLVYTDKIERVQKMLKDYITEITS